MAQPSHLADRFNAYHQWLGIPPAELPPHHYRLLGLVPFEDDPDVISNAADRQMGHVKSFASGPQAAESQALLNELSKARLCLLNPTRKAEYDEWLAEQLYESEGLEDEADDQAFDEVGEYDEENFAAFDAVPTVAATISPVVRRRRRRKSSGMGLSLGILLIGGGIVAGLLWYAAEQRPASSASPAPDGETVAGSSEAEPNRPPEGSTPNRPPSIPTPVPRQVPDTPINPERPPIPPGEPGEPKPAPPSHPPFGGQRPSPPSTTPATTAALFAALPTAVELPEEGSNAAELAKWNIESYQLAELTLELLNPDFAQRSGSGLYLHRHVQAEDSAAWLLLDEGEVDPLAAEQQGADLAERALASVRVADGTLVFEWAPTLNDPEQRDRARMGVLRFHHRGTTHDMQLRTPLVDPVPVVLGNWQEIFEHRIDLEDLSPLPPMGSVAMRIEFQKGFPAMQVQQGDPTALREGQQLMMQFTGTDYAGVGVIWQTKGKKLAIATAPGFTLESSKGIEVLSRDQVNRVEQRLINQRRKAEQEFNRRVGNRTALERKLQAALDLNIELPGGGTTQQLRAMKLAGIKKARGEIASNEARINALRELGTAINKDLQTRIPRLRTLATELEGKGVIGVELYYPVREGKVVLYQMGISGNKTMGKASKGGWSAVD